MSSSAVAVVFSKSTSHFFNRTCFSTFSTSTYLPSSLSPSLWKRRICVAGVKPIRLCFTLSRFRVHYYSTTAAPGSVAGRKRSKKKKLDPELSTAMEEEKDAFYVVRKGDIVGVHKSLSDCQAQVGTSVCDPSVSVFKGYSLSKEADEYLTSCGLKSIPNA
ncbi:Rnase h family protein [Thalictrum thalictroides]|uniref:Rnase h family protein n=1 Tax=Thalictrum thalictroides TaxID=46969 RepID=A0A7J6VZF5_THATH|nr:Rnase h family protein [Thalictrum thalictroides]